MNRFLLLIAAPGLFLTSSARAAEPPALKVMQTPSGIRFGLRGEKGTAPAPVLFVFAGSIEDSLRDVNYCKAGNILAGHGFLSVSLDVPCHGGDVPKGEPAGLQGWRARLEKDDDLVSAFNKKASAVLDYLIKEGYVDPKRVTACGTSRGGFIALHWAAAEPRVRCVAAFAPVTELLVVTEFAALAKNPTAQALSLERHADKLAGRPVWLCIGNDDQRVGTDHAIAFTRKLVAAGRTQKKPAPVELHVMQTQGHSIHPTAHDEAAAWILTHLKER
jgi:dienelactone hydrolase